MVFAPVALVDEVYLHPLDRDIAVEAGFRSCSQGVEHSTGSSLQHQHLRTRLSQWMQFVDGVLLLQV